MAKPPPEKRSSSRFLARVVPGALPRPMSGFVEPALPTLRSTPPAGDQWVHEIKFDGYRLQAHLRGGSPTLFTRSGYDWTNRFARIATALAQLPVNEIILDGEAIVQDISGVSDFAALEADLETGRQDRFVFYAFNLLHLDGFDIRNAPLEQRKRVLATLLMEASATAIAFSEHLAIEGADMFENAMAMGLEGIVSKRRDAPYRSGRGASWLKVKTVRKETFVVVGYASRKKALSSLHLARRTGKRLVYAGQAGTGFDATSSASIALKLRDYATDEPALSVPAITRHDHWVQPKLLGDRVPGSLCGRIAQARLLQGADGRLDPARECPTGWIRRSGVISLDELSESNWVEVAQFNTRQEAEQNALVLVAAGISSQIIAGETTFAILVANTDAIEARRELTAYAEENRPAVTQPLPSVPLRESLTGVMAYWGALLFLNSASIRHAFDIDWFSIGEGSAGRIVAGEWWRAFTALSLHVDLGHLLSNLAAGSLFGFFLSEFLGSGLAWFLILLAGAGGNTLNAFLHSPSHTSVGASTAIFGAIGLLAALALRYRRSQWKTGLRRWAPLSAGVMLLAFLGIEGERIDIGAHLAGFFVGCAIGGLLLTIPPRAASRGTTIAFGSAALGLFVGAWIVAVRSSGL